MMSGMTPEQMRAVLEASQKRVDNAQKALDDARADLARELQMAWDMGVRDYEGHHLQQTSPRRYVDTALWTDTDPEGRFAWVEYDRAHYRPKPSLKSVRDWAVTVYGKDGAEEYISRISTDDGSLPIVRSVKNSALPDEEEEE